MSPRGAGAPSDDSLHTIVRRDGDHWVVLFDRTSWGEPYGRRATFRLGSDDSFIIDFDLATVDDCRYYLSDRVNRRHYLAMIPLLERVVALKQQESAAEAPFRQLLAGRIATEHGVAVADAEVGLDELVSWWKFKTRTHRALSSDDRSALRMIVAEFGLRRSQAMEIERRAAAGAAVVDAVRQQFPNAILVAHKREAEYVALVAYNDEDVFVAEQTWSVDRRSGQPRLRSEKPWTVVDARSERWRELWASGRWEGWPRRLRAREHLTGPEREAALAWALERIAESPSRFRNCLTRFTRARPIVAAFGAKDRLRIWVWTAPSRVPKVALLSDDVSTPEVRVVRIEWERTKAGLTFQLDHPSGAMAADSNSLPWNASPSSSGQSRRQSNGAPVRVVWTDAETLAALRGDVARAKEASQRRQALYSLVWKYDRQVGARMHEIAVERAYRAFLDEFHAPDLWEGHLKSLPEISIPHRDRLGRALSLLVERNEPVAGRTVAEVLAAASAIGLEARDGDRDRDGLPLDFRLEPLEPEPVDEDEEAPL